MLNLFHVKKDLIYKALDDFPACVKPTTAKKLFKVVGPNKTLQALEKN